MKRRIWTAKLAPIPLRCKYQAFVLLVFTRRLHAVRAGSGTWVFLTHSARSRNGSRPPIFLVDFCFRSWLALEN